MEELLPRLLAFPPQPPPARPLTDLEYDEQIHGLLQILNRTSGGKLASGVKGKGNLLDILDPAINSIPYLHTILDHLHTAKARPDKDDSSILTTPPGGPLWDRIVAFLACFDARQIRYAGAEWRRLLEVVAKSARSRGKPLLAVRPIRDAMLRLDPAGATFTTNHVLFVKLCLEANTYRAALPIVDREILDFPSPNPNTQSLPSTLDQPSSGYMTASSGHSAWASHTGHMEYHLCGAMIYIGLKKWERALELLSFVIATPTANTTSTIMVEAYKKWVLVSLLHAGEMTPLPGPTNVHVAKSLHALARAYDNIAEVFGSGNAWKLGSELEAGRELWKKDNNLGLVGQIPKALVESTILNLENTYSTLSLGQVASRLGSTDTTPDGVERTILHLISTGRLAGTLSHPREPSPTSGPLLTFSPTSSKDASEAARLRETEAQIERTLALSAHIRQVDRKLGLSRDVLAWTARARKGQTDARGGGVGGGGGSGGGGGVGGGGMTVGEAMEMAWDDDDDVLGASGGGGRGLAQALGGGGFGSGDEDMMAGF
ncbi:MAG: hypothetical protein M1832_004424 [Thelocarpon impressellum]|nr:MAG: hypothetical protein M1832_004424 [Thelocarpon impressellum]